MPDEHIARDVQSTLDAIDRGETSVPCDKLAMTFQQIAQDGNNLNAERRTEISWEAAVCQPYVRPAIYRHDEQTGFTSLPDIPDAGKDYLAGRAQAIQNQFLIARYSDYLQEVAYGKKYTHALRAIDAYLASCAQLVRLTETRHAIYLIDNFDRAVQLALQYQSRPHVEACVSAGMNLIRQLQTTTGHFGADTTPVGRWTHELMEIQLQIRQSGKMGQTVTDQVLREMMDIAEDLAGIHLYRADHDSAQHNLDLAITAARLLGVYEAASSLRLQRTSSMEMLEVGETPASLDTQLRLGLQLCEALQEYQDQYGDERTPEAHRTILLTRMAALKTRMRQAFQQGAEAIGSIEAELTLEPEHKQAISSITQAAHLNEALAKLGQGFYPNAGAAKSAAAAIMQSGMLVTLLPVISLAHDMPIDASAETAERERNFRNLDLQRQILQTGLAVTQVLNHLMESMALDGPRFLAFLTGWQVIDADNLRMIGVGIDRYFQGDYISAMHVLVPQFEHVIRTAFEKAGHPVIKSPNSGSSWQFELFGTFLEQEYVKASLGPDLLIYIRTLMTEQTGWNLRNEVAHGLISTTLCTESMVGLVLHLYLALTQLSISAPPSGDTDISNGDIAQVALAQAGPDLTARLADGSLIPYFLYRRIRIRAYFHHENQTGHNWQDPVSNWLQAESEFLCSS